MKINKHITKTLLKISMVVLLSILWTTTTFADQSPAGCTGSGLNIFLDVNNQPVHIGDNISYGVTVLNGLGVGPVVCDASGITASLVTPDGTNHPITLIRTTLTNGQSDHYPNVVTYTARSQDVKPDGTLRATASDTGVIHQNDTNSQGGGEQGVNVTVISTPTPPSSSSDYLPPPSIPSSPSSSGGGTAYGCKDQNALNYNYFATSNPALCIYTATSTIVSPAVATTTVITTTVIIPKLPKTGFPPREDNIPWNIVMLTGIFMLVSASSIVFLRKSKI
jgi:hypothetical protein